MSQPQVAMWQAGAAARARAKLYPVACLVILLLLLLPLRCIHFTDPAADYARARQLFESGYLANGQEEAARGYARFLSTRPEWASQFLLLEAESMIWRGMNESALHRLSAQPVAFYRPEALVEKLSLEAVAYTRLQQFSEAARRLADSDRMCAANPYATCGGFIRAEGILALELGKFAQAKDYFLRSLSFARDAQRPHSGNYGSSLHRRGFAAERAL